MARRISQLTALTSASLDTTLLGVDRGVSYKIELDVLADAVKDRINTLDDIRLDSLESFTASYSVTGIPAGTISSSTQITALGFISNSTETNISSLNTFTQSIDGRVDSLENWSSSLTDTFATDLEVSIVSSSVAATIAIVSSATGLVTTSSFNAYTASQTSLNNTLATTGSNIFNGSQKVNSFVTASYYEGDGGRLYNLPSTTNWNKDKEYILKNTEQLTFSGDYMLENTALLIEGDDEQVQYSSNKSFKKEGSIFIGGNLLVKDSYIENNGKISVGGEVILIGESGITGTGKII
jgi:hypothetical protein